MLELNEDAWAVGGLPFTPHNWPAPPGKNIAIEALCV
jgi:hypothetical protein